MTSLYERGSCQKGDFHNCVINMRVRNTFDFIRKTLYIQRFMPFEPPRGKTNNLHMGKQRRRSASRYREADQRLCFRNSDSTIPLLLKSEISSF